MRERPGYNIIIHSRFKLLYHDNTLLEDTGVLFWGLFHVVSAKNVITTSIPYTDIVVYRYIVETVALHHANRQWTQRLFTLSIFALRRSCVYNTLCYVCLWWVHTAIEAIEGS